jgi:hypothetical protein
MFNCVGMVPLVSLIVLFSCSWTILRNIFLFFDLFETSGISLEGEIIYV